jgi:hypothetical protein
MALKNIPPQFQCCAVGKTMMITGDENEACPHSMQEIVAIQLHGELPVEVLIPLCRGHHTTLIDLGVFEVEDVAR